MLEMNRWIQGEQCCSETLAYGLLGVGELEIWAFLGGFKSIWGPIWILKPSSRQSSQEKQERRGGIPEACFIEGGGLVTKSPAIRSYLSYRASQVGAGRWHLRAPGICRIRLRTVSLCDALRIRYLHRLEVEICLSLWATRWRRQPFNHLCLKNKPLSGANQTCFLPHTRLQWFGDLCLRGKQVL